MFLAYHNLLISFLSCVIIPFVDMAITPKKNCSVMS